MLQEAGEATIRVFVNPLVPLVWGGGLLMLLGGLICWWPRKATLHVGRSVANMLFQSGSMSFTQ